MTEKMRCWHCDKLIEADETRTFCVDCWASKGYSVMSANREWKQKIQDILEFVDCEADRFSLSKDAVSVRDLFIRELEKLVGDNKWV